MLRTFVILAIIVVVGAGDSIRSSAVVTALYGDVKIIHAGSNEITDAQLLDDLFEGDSLKTSEESEATILYEDGKIVAVGASHSLHIVLPSEDTLRGSVGEEPLFSKEIGAAFSPLFVVGTGAEKIVPKVLVRAPEDTIALIMHMPGNTTLLTARPDVIWSSYPEANWYAVVFQQMGEILISIATTDTMFLYAEEKEDLEPGTYLIRVFAFKNSDTLSAAERFIRILTPEDAEKIQAIIDTIAAQGPDSYTFNLLKAKVYEKYSLRLNALHAYESLIDMNPDVPFVYKSIASLYYELQMPDKGNEYLDMYKKLTAEDD